jgi:chromosome segregation ATPase
MNRIAALILGLVLIVSGISYAQVPITPPDPLETMERRVRDLEKGLERQEKESAREKKSLQDQLDRAKVQEDALLKRVGALETALGGALRHPISVGSRLDTAESANGTLKTDVARVDGKADGVKKLFDDLKPRVDVVEREKADLDYVKTFAEDLNRFHDDVAWDVTSLKEGQSTLELQGDNHEERLATQLKVHNDLKDHVGRHEQRFETVDKKAVENEGRISNVTEQVRILEERSNTFQSQIAKLTGDLTQARNDLEQGFRDGVKAVRDEMRELKTTLGKDITQAAAIGKKAALRLGLVFD